MSVAEFNSSLSDFLNSKEPEIVAIKGRWGTGKTYSWDAVASRHRDGSGAGMKYAYASLFGADSLWQIKLTLLARLHASKKSGWMHRLLNSKKTFNSTVHLLGLMSGGENLAKAISEWSPTLLDNATVCFDDFERMDTKSISHEKILGFISELKLEHKCKVVLIYNSDAIQSDSKFHEYREKVVDREIEYSPSYEDIVEIAGGLKEEVRDIAVECVKILELNNVRVVRKAVRSTNQILGKYPHTPRFELEKRLISSALLFSWIEFGAGKSEIPTEIQENLGENFSRALVEHYVDNKPLGSWQKRLQRYGFTSFDNLDALIQSCVKTGFAASDQVQKELNRFEQTQIKDSLISRHLKAWSLFHDSLENNEALFLNELVDSFRAAALYESPSSLNSVVRILKELGHNELAKEMIETYIKCRSPRDEVFDLKNHRFPDDVTDQDIKDSFSSAMSIASETLEGDIDQLASILKSGNRLSNLQQALLSACTVDQVVHILKTHHGQELDLIIGGMLRYRGTTQAPKIGELAMNALKQISAEGKYQELRTKRYLSD